MGSKRLEGRAKERARRSERGRQTRDNNDEAVDGRASELMGRYLAGGGKADKQPSERGTQQALAISLSLSLQSTMCQIRVGLAAHRRADRGPSLAPGASCPALRRGRPEQPSSSRSAVCRRGRRNWRGSTLPKVPELPNCAKDSNASSRPTSSQLSCTLQALQRVCRYRTSESRESSAAVEPGLAAQPTPMPTCFAPQENRAGPETERQTEPAHAPSGPSSKCSREMQDAR